jgi:hypothetical protein
MNPLDTAAGRHKEIRQACERVAKAEAAHAESTSRVEQLKQEVGPAEYRDKQKLGEAIVNGKAEPQSEAVQLKAELEREQRRQEALALAATSAREQIGKLVAVNKDAWRRRAMQELARANARYQESISALQEAREALSNEATMVAWLDSGSSGEAATDPLGGRQGLDPISFTRTLEALRQDCEQLANHPVTRTDPVASPRFELAHGAGAQGLQWEGGE